MIPRITLVTPSFNQGQYLEETINSVLSQGYSNLEYMILDGGSTDNTLEIIRKYEKYLTFWRSNKDAGQYAAIVEGLNRGTGEIQGWINSDDLLFPHTLKTIADQFLANPQVEWITGIPCEKDTQGELVYGKSIPQPSRDHFLKDLFWCPYIQQEGSFWKTSLWQKAGSRFGEQCQLAGDLDLWLKLSRFTEPWVTDCALGIFRKHGDQKSAAQYAQYLSEAFQLIDKENATHPSIISQQTSQRVLRTGINTPRFQTYPIESFNSPNSLATTLCYLKSFIPLPIYQRMLKAVMQEPELKNSIYSIFLRLGTSNPPSSNPTVLQLLESIKADSQSFENIAPTNPPSYFTVATSIAPKGLELQRKAITSWQNLGFDVLSFNNSKEVAELAPLFPDIRFITVHRDGTQRSGKPLVYVQDILSWFRDQSSIRYGGFINSDIVVQPENAQGFIELLKREISGSLIFSRRIEVQNITELKGKWNRTGIDLWLWDREILHCFTEPADYMVGFPHWDYYMELMPICHGIPVKQLAIPNAYHQTHDAYYDWVRDAVPFALTTFKLIYPHLHKVPDQDHLLLPTIHYCFKHQPEEIKTQDDLEFLAMFLNTLDKFFLETIDRCSLKLNYTDIPHVPQDNRLPLCHNPRGFY